MAAVADLTALDDERDRRARAMQIACGVVAATGVAAIIAAALQASGVLVKRKKKKSGGGVGLASLDMDRIVVSLVEGQVKSNAKHVGKAIIAPFLIASLAATLGVTTTSLFNLEWKRPKKSWLTLWF
jgi:hypothetical protein